ncbi:MAG: hypothetical protein KDA41_15130 [Planctomycetales bacterium]|nr:hypothetical protein [Planctomycetales bacterium]
MGVSRKQAWRRMRGLELTLLEHLDNHVPALLHENPDAAPHWRQEMNAWIAEIERLAQYTGKRTSDEWKARTAGYRIRVAELLGQD